MNISLTPTLEKFVQAKVSEGLYGSVSEVIREALRLFISQESTSSSKIEILDREIDKGLDDIKSGRFSDGDEVMKRLRKEITK
jgi:antitoxin ParD1/3/4